MIKDVKNENSLSHLHFIMPLIFFQGFIKTILFNELNKVSLTMFSNIILMKLKESLLPPPSGIKWYASCLNGTTHLAQLLVCFGVSSFLSIFSLTLLIIVCNLKRNVS